MSKNYKIQEQKEKEKEEEEEEEDIEVLDDKWIKDFELNDKLYEDFYLEDVYYTNIHFVYIDVDKNIEKIIEETFLMSVKNEINNVELTQILKKSKTNNNSNNKKYLLLEDVLKCNITLKPEDISTFITSSNLNDYYDKFVTPLKTTSNTITFEKTISMFQDLNDLFIILYECSSPNSSATKTRKNYHKLQHNNNNNNKKTLKKTI